MSTSVVGFAATTLQAAMANVLAGVEYQITALNTAMQTDYMTRFNNWVQQFQAFQTDAAAPQPPNAYTVGYFTDTTNPAAQWAYPVVGTSPVCAQPPIPTRAAVAPVNTAVSVSRVGDKQNVPVGDTMPTGFKATAPDGSVWQKMASATPFGVAQYYERIA